MIKKILKKSLQIILICLISTSIIRADFSVKLTKQVNLNDDSEVEARIDSIKQIIKGVVAVNPSATKIGANDINITWTHILGKSDSVNVDGLISTATIESDFLKRGLTLLVRGQLPDKFQKNLDDKEKQEDKKRDISSTGGTNISTGSSSPNQVDTNLKEDLLTPPEYITTFEGCNQIYDKNKEVIYVYQRTYYIDKNNQENIVTDCSFVKEYPANKKVCEILNDYDTHITYTRYQPFFKDKETEYGAGGCVIGESFMQQIDFEACPAKPIGDQYVKQGKRYYSKPDGEKIYVTDCIIDPLNEAKQLDIEYKSCLVEHNIEKNQSKQLFHFYISMI